MKKSMAQLREGKITDKRRKRRKNGNRDIEKRYSSVEKDS